MSLDRGIGLISRGMAQQLATQTQPQQYAGGPGANQAPQPPESPYMERILADLHGARSRLEEEAQRIAAVAERFLGCLPATSTTGANAPAPAGVVEHLGMVGSAIHGVVDRISEARQRLERL